MEKQSNKIVSVVVVSQGKTEMVFPCLASLKSQTYPGIEVIFIDNSLQAVFSQEIIQRYPRITIHSSPRNLFYCKALNVGIALSKGAFILCLNDDVVLERDFIEKALGAFSVDERIGMVSGKIFRADAATLDSTGLFLTPWRTARERGYGRPERGLYQKAEYIFGVNGAAALYRKSMLDDIKEESYFDNDFRIFLEDLDIAWRAQRAGWKGYYVPQARAYHVRGATVRIWGGTDKAGARRFLSDRLHADLIKNRYLAMIKNESAAGFCLRFPCIALYDVLVWLYAVLFCPRQIRMFAANMRYLKAAWKKRRLRR